MWDPDRLAQVIANLASNAVHYGRAGATVAVTLSREADTAIIVVHNELRGEPVSETKLQAAFDPFTRGDSGEHHSGLGLGLYIVSEIVRAHGGTISASSGVHGTEFRVGLPLARSSPVSWPTAEA
jgi:signal transduction histidine kinase